MTVGCLQKVCFVAIATDVGWPADDGEWLAFGHGQGWVRRDAIAEIAVVDYFADEQPYGSQLYD